MEISIDIDHFVASLVENFKNDDPIYLMGTIQFNKAIYVAKSLLEKLHSFTRVEIP